ncbi:MAG: hypothetical protein H0V19_07975 [Euzebyales bacterium]|nr:hypothetical protein [Euzebyales bacterium]
MRRVLVVALAAVFTVALLPAAGGAADPSVSGFSSPNVTHVGTLPLDSPGVGARVVKLGKQTRLYVTGVKGLTIYDVSAPATPRIMGTLPLPHWENEDVSVSDDGATVLISVESSRTALFIIDASNPALPRVASVLESGSHTATCVDGGCDWVYTSSGFTYDLRDKTDPHKLAQGWQDRAKAQGVTFRQNAHDLNVDDAGLVVSDTVPRVMLDPRQDPRNPTVLTTGSPGSAELAYQHNNLRPDATRWSPRSDSQTGDALRPGELLLSNGETNATVNCDGSTNGPFATWSLRDFDKGRPMEVLDVYRPVSGDYADGNPAVNTLGCSGHWFTERDGLVAAGWYEHGTRFLKVDQQTGEIREVGFFQPVVGSASAAHWVSRDYVYVIDYERGIDILHFDRTPEKRPTRRQMDESWLAKAGVVSAVAEQERLFCTLAQQ